MIEKNDTTSKNGNPSVIKTDLVFPLKILEIYQEHLLGIIKTDVANAKRDLHNCDEKLDAGASDIYTRLERCRAQTTIETLHRAKSFMYIPWNIRQELLGQNYYITLEFKNPTIPGCPEKQQVLSK